MLAQSHKELVVERSQHHHLLCRRCFCTSHGPGVLDYTPALNANLNVDDTGNTFAGVLKVSIVSTSILILQTSLLTSTTLLVTKVLHLTTQVCSIAHTYLSRWFVLLANTFRIKLGLQDSLRYHCKPICRRHSKIKVLALLRQQQPLLPSRCCQEPHVIHFHKVIREGLRTLFFCI